MQFTAEDTLKMYYEISYMKAIKEMKEEGNIGISLSMLLGQTLTEILATRKTGCTSKFHSQGCNRTNVDR